MVGKILTDSLVFKNLKYEQSNEIVLQSADNIDTDSDTNDDPLSFEMDISCFQ